MMTKTCFETFQIRILLTQLYLSCIDDHIICEFSPCLQDFTIPLIKKKVLYPPVNVNRSGSLSETSIGYKHERGGLGGGQKEKVQVEYYSTLGNYTTLLGTLFPFLLAW